jgi:hypothetical protein
MDISVIAATHPNYKASKAELDKFGGRAAGVCYMANDFAALSGEPEEKTMKRAKMTKQSGHHSVYDHSNITLYLHCIPRVLEILLDNERYMVSSVKSGRYTLHPLPAKEQKVYDKWLAKFQQLIKDKYRQKYPKYFTENKVTKLAMENARYITSCFTEVSMLHTMSYRQFNYVCGFLRAFVNAKQTNTFVKKLVPYVKEFLKQCEATGYIDEDLMANGKNRRLSLFNNHKVKEYFGDVYATSYKCSFTCYAHLNRHRTLKYYIAEPAGELEFYVPEILEDEADRAEWLNDLHKLEKNFPQAMLVTVTEMGNCDDFILKAIERKCSVVQLETTRVVNAVIQKYIKAFPNETLLTMTKGAKCTFGNYICPTPCGFAEAVNETRKI